MSNDWSKTWNKSKKPSKQRKYRRNAPLHVKDKMVSANLSDEIREELGTRTLGLRAGDRVKVMRGDFSGSTGIVSNVDRDEEKVYVDGLEHEKNDGTKREFPFRPSNLQIQGLNLEDTSRIEKYDVEEVTGIEVEKEEVEEVLEKDEESEMMKQMQGGDTEEETEDEDSEESSDSQSSEQEEDEEEDLEEVEEEVEEAEEKEEEIEEQEEEIEEELDEVEEELEEGEKE